MVVCGLSGSGKTSFALDTLYAEGQRRYIESFSAYTRQFLERLETWGLITGTAEPLAGIAAEVGFSDQAHMTRDVKALTGKTPGAWRAAA